MKDGAGDRIGGLSTRLLVLFLAMVVVGFVLPSPGIATGPGAGSGHHYRALATPAKLSHTGRTIELYSPLPKTQKPH